MKARNTALSVAFCLFLAGPAFMAGVDKAGVFQLPDWATSESAAYLSGGITEADVKSHLSLKGFSSQKLQKDIEATVGNNIPLKATALLANAGLQRSVIGLSNQMWRFPCYPTFFGSDYVLIPQEHAVAAMPLPAGGATSNALRKFGKSVASFAEKNPDIRCVVYVADISNTSLANPAHSLVSNSLSTNEVAGEIQAGVAKGVPVVASHTGDDVTSYYQLFFRSDHHWNARGAALAFEDIMQSLGAEGRDFKFKLLDGPVYSGAYSRNSLCIVDDVPFDIDFDFNQEVMETARGQVDGNQHVVYDDASEQAKHWQFYDLFYELFPHTRSGVGSGNVLLVSDSFGGALVRPFGLAFENVWVRNTLHASSKTEERLSDIVSSCDIDTVIFVGHATNYSSFESRNPRFFG
jgi:hypothetical protein